MNFYRNRLFFLLERRSSLETIMKFITALIYGALLLFISADAQTSCHSKDDCSGGDLCCWGPGKSRVVNRDAGNNALPFVSHLLTLAALEETANKCVGLA
ncbi:hypothetical protein DFJ43DRAFT_1225704 [Lentinula guzmanii]|uniref:Uncharacterized protein n=1 Tax=Lentinula guzmanii TaxID=2804957 RepID=A0AA38MXQ3_9AGAR|nr:hypothetical protein DFJ43DRAFT_1225704 [Lentinula guzmanii]